MSHRTVTCMLLSRVAHPVLSLTCPTNAACSQCQLEMQISMYKNKGPSKPERSVLTSPAVALRGGGKEKGRGKGKGKGRAREDSGVSKEPQMSTNERQHAGKHEFEEDSKSDIDADLEVDGDGDGEVVLDVMARFRGERKQDCKFIIVTGE